MTDVVDSKKRSEMMSGIKAKNTRPELQIRKALHSRGFRYRLHLKNLPGKPDIVLSKYHAVIFVNGCFWHLHECHLFKWPTTRSEFWFNKINENKQKDIENIQLLSEKGWRILIIWECSVKGKEKIDFNLLINNVIHWLVSNNNYFEIKGENKNI